MKKNMGSADRTIRIIVAVLLGILILTGTVSGTLAIVLGIFGVVFLLTSFISFCPLYVPLKLSTRKADEKK
jgi:hypothetical protein